MSRRNGIDRAIVLTECRKLYLGGLRFHHGLTGEALMVLGLVLLVLINTEAGAITTGVGTVLVIHDWHDFPFRLIDRPGDGPRATNQGDKHGINH